MFQLRRTGERESTTCKSAGAFPRVKRTALRTQQQDFTKDRSQEMSNKGEAMIQSQRIRGVLALEKLEG
jgi:hypothetical protein